MIAAKAVTFRPQVAVWEREVPKAVPVVLPGNRDFLIRDFPSRAKVSRCNHDIDSFIRFERNAGSRGKSQHQRQKRS